MVSIPFQGAHDPIHDHLWTPDFKNQCLKAWLGREPPSYLALLMSETKWDRNTYLHIIKQVLITVSQERRGSINKGFERIKMMKEEENEEENTRAGEGVIPSESRLITKCTFYGKWATYVAGLWNWQILYNCYYWQLKAAYLIVSQLSFNLKEVHYYH